MSDCECQFCKIVYEYQELYKGGCIACWYKKFLLIEQELERLKNPPPPPVDRKKLAPHEISKLRKAGKL